jgi:hypothetical protein
MHTFAPLCVAALSATFDWLTGLHKGRLPASSTVSTRNPTLVMISSVVVGMSATLLSMLSASEVNDANLS